jgi:hypothetical protein
MAMRPHQKRYLIESVPALGLYLIATYGSVWLVRHFPEASLWQRILIALLPLPAIVWVLVALMRRLLHKDELEARVELVAIAIASVVVGIASLAWGMLDMIGLVPPISVFYVLPAMMLVYGVVKCETWRRYG